MVDVSPDADREVAFLVGSLVPLVSPVIDAVIVASQLPNVPDPVRDSWPVEFRCPAEETAMRERTPPWRRVTYDQYVIAAALTLARRHRPKWSWRKWRWVCRCGADLPCRNRHRVPINRGHWPPQEDQ